MLKVNDFKNRIHKNCEQTQAARNEFLKPAVNVAAPFIEMAVAAESKKPKLGQSATNILKSISGGKILNLTDEHGHGLRLKVV